MMHDIRDLLQDWKYDSDSNIRVLCADDGRMILQVRLPLGMEQYEMDGRPDGQRPSGYDTFFALMEDRLSTWKKEHGSDEGFTIGRDDFQGLQGESILFYYRYLVLFQLNDYERVKRDTNHNMLTCRMLDSYCLDEDEKNSVLQFRPYIIRMHSMATSMLAVQQHDPHAGMKILESAIQEIESLELLPSPVFQFERSRSVSYLTTALEQMREKEVRPEKALEEELAKALADENYEHAAELRDQIRNLIDKAHSA